MTRSAEYAIYIVGVVLLGVAYAPAKAWFPSEAWFAATAFAYLVALRIVGRLVSRRLQR